MTKRTLAAGALATFGLALLVLLPVGASSDLLSAAPLAGWEHTERRSGDAVTAITRSGGTVSARKGSGEDPDAATDTESSDAKDDGENGTDLATFAVLELGGVALVAALAALIMGRHRIPS